MSGLEATVRKFLPYNHNIVIATFGAYGGSWLLYKLMSKSDDKAAAAPAAAASAASSTSFSTSGEDKYLGEWEKTSENIEGFFKYIDNPENYKKWEATLK